MGIMIAGHRCDRCGNEYDRLISIRDHEGRLHSFDCFECAIDTLAPRCHNCGVPVVGHGVEVDQHIYCGGHCMRVAGMRDPREHEFADPIDETSAMSFPASDPPARW